MRPTQAQLAAAQAKLQQRDNERAAADARLRNDLQHGDREIEALQDRLIREKVARDTVPDVGVPPRLQGWGGDHGHLSVDARINESTRQARVAHWRANRPGLEEQVLTAPPVAVPVSVEDPRAGLLRLLCDGDGWVVRIRGVDYSCGTVTNSERDFNEDDQPTFRPRQAVINAAAERALADPLGPEQPIGSIWFGSDENGEPVEHIVGEQLEPQRPTISATLRARVAARMGQHRD